LNMFKKLKNRGNHAHSERGNLKRVLYGRKLKKWEKKTIVRL